MNGMPAYSMWWLLILRDWYQYTGDKAFPAKHREYIRALTAQILRQVEPDGRLALDDYFLDWSTHGMPEARAGVQALAALSMDAAAVLCRLLEDEDTAVGPSGAQRRCGPMAGTAGRSSPRPRCWPWRVCCPRSGRGKSCGWTVPGACPPS